MGTCRWHLIAKGLKANHRSEAAGILDTQLARELFAVQVQMKESHPLIKCDYL